MRLVFVPPAFALVAATGFLVTHHAGAADAHLRAEPPQALWSATVPEAHRTVYLCADGVILRGLAHPLPEIHDKPCQITGRTYDTPTRYSVRCNIGRDSFVADSNISGDRTRDFTVQSAIQPWGKGAPVYKQTRHYQRVAMTCPVGWATGDSAAAGDRQVVNSVSGARHDLPAPFTPPH
ncbi:MAG: hypothetical protein JSR45_17475 [Proteobacteria bacterium]|nr:hypothetical protein [Pseudomonadota bacterium]